MCIFHSSPMYKLNIYISSRSVHILHCHSMYNVYNTFYQIHTYVQVKLVIKVSFHIFQILLESKNVPTSNVYSIYAASRFRTLNLKQHLNFKNQNSTERSCPPRWRVQGSGIKVMPLALYVRLKRDLFLSGFSHKHAHSDKTSGNVRHRANFLRATRSYRHKRVTIFKCRRLAKYAPSIR